MLFLSFESHHSVYVTALIVRGLEDHSNVNGTVFCSVTFRLIAFGIIMGKEAASRGDAR